MTGEVVLQGGGEKFETIARLALAGFDHRQDLFNESAACRALGTKGELSPDDGGAQGTLADVVCRLDPFDIQEPPQPVAMIVQGLAHPDELRVAAEDAAQQQAVDLLADRLQQTQHSRACDRTVAVTYPVPKQLACGTQQVVPQTFHLLLWMIGQGLKIAI